MILKNCRRYINQFQKMNLQPIFSKIKTNGKSIVVYSFLLLIIFNPTAKAWLLQQLISIGLFNATIKKEGIAEMPENIALLYTTPDGKTANISDLRGKVVFINFWASWCPPCRAEMPSIAALYQKLQKDKRFVFLLMNEDDDRQKAMDYLEKNHFDLPIHKRAGAIPNAIFSGSLPTTIVINKEGKIVLKKEGMGGYDSDSFIKQLNDLL